MVNFPKTLKIIFITLIIGVVSFLASSFFLIKWSSEGSDDYAGGIIIRDAAGEVMRVSLGENDVDCRPYYVADENDWIVKALVAAEDGEFWSHYGVRPLSAIRAMAQNLFYRRRISGASTITMQAVRLIKPHPKTLWWKWKESIMALKMEREKSKKWILSQYLNRAPYGANFIGIEAAASGWFGKSAKDLGIGEAAMLAGMVQAPSRFRPDRNYNRAFHRRDYVLARMKKLGYITEEQRLAARSVRPVVCRSPRPFKYPYFCDYVLLSLGKDRAMQRKCGVINTSLDADIQSKVINVVDNASRDGGYSVAAVVMKASTGEVVALHCSGNYFGGKDGQVNTALAPRPAGSTLKPFLAAIAMDMGLVTPSTRLWDAPMSVKGYRPANFDSAYRGLVTLSDSLILSLNIPFVRLLAKIGVESFGDKLRALGFKHLNKSDADSGLGMAIGNVEVTLVELTSAYQKLSCGDESVFSRESCYLISEILSGGERSSASLGHIADVVTSRFAWKTGTSSAYRDAWTVAWNPEYVIGVWCGHKRGGFGDKTLVGAKAAAPVCWKIARQLYPQGVAPWYVKPQSIKAVEVCSHTGSIASDDCPKKEKGDFIKGISSPRPCTIHRRGTDGKVVALDESEKKSFKIISPENNALFHLVEAGLSERIVFRLVGAKDNERFWWFVDGAAGGESLGNEAFVLEMEEGDHSVIAVNGTGESSRVDFKILRSAKNRGKK
jgi:penicillin-binding protein 1C